MTYAQYGTVSAADFNTLVGGNPTTTVNTLNATWATGGSSAGYGQTDIANVSVGSNVAAVGQWANLVTVTANAATHQGTSITAVTAPVAGGTITYLSAIPTNLTTIYSSRLNAATQGSSISNAATYSSTWSTALVFTHTVTFANGDAARYFFNSGGQLKVTCSHANNTAGVNLLLNNLASNVGTVAMSSPVTGSITISSTTFNGITKIGGGGATPTISTNSGYYAMTTSNANVFTQAATTGPAYYLATNINIKTKSNGTQGSNGDSGSIITIYTTWDEVPDGYAVGAGTTTTVTVQAPETTQLANTWGTLSVTGTVSVS